MGKRLNAFLKLSTTKAQNSSNRQASHQQKSVKFIPKYFESTIFFNKNIWKSKLMLTNFIQISKLFILFSVFYSQPKIKNFGVWQTTPLNRNLVPRFGETREKDKEDLHVSTLPWFGINEMKEWTCMIKWIWELHRIARKIKINDAL